MGQTTIQGVGRLFTPKKGRAYDQLRWVKTDSIIENPITKQPVFEQTGVEFPEGWSLNSINIIAQRYLTGTPGTDNREHSLKQLIDRVVDTITRQGQQEGYFDTASDAEDFREELKFVLATQRAAFNTPVWSNVGAHSRPQQASACFILSVEDNMPAILNWYVEEGMIFKGGSGSGINLSNIRSSVEPSGNNGVAASGPVSFMRGADTSVSAIKKRGNTGCPANTVILNVDHPDIEEFIWSKVIEERKARDLQSMGWDMGPDGKDSFSVQYQNTNTSVRVTDEFMKSVEADDKWDLRAVTTGKPVKTVRARDLFKQISEAAWESAHPGMQFDTTINKWQTTPKAGRINGSNTGGEYMHLDNSACNLASINLLKYLNDDLSFAIEDFKHTVELVFTAQEILVGYGEYPTKKISQITRAFRELGIGYANLGALLMAQGLPYDSEEGRAQAAAITALMTGHAYSVSSRIARQVGPFAGYNKDREGVLRVIKMHRDEVSSIDASLVSEDLLNAAVSAWDEAVELGELYGLRNSQASLLDATGTTALMMDCDTAGIEPELGLVKDKKLLGDDTVHVVHQTIPRALTALGYTDKQVSDVIKYIDSEKTILGAPHLKTEHEPVFACSVGDNPIGYMGHVKMMAAVQPFLSGAISKTVNMPEEATVEDIEELHIQSWKMGLKTVVVYRDNSKVPQPLTVARKDDAEKQEEHAHIEDKIVLKGAVRRNLPKVRNSRTYKFQLADLRGYFTVGEYEDGAPGELFVNVSKQGSTLSGLTDTFAISVSNGLQYGVPLKRYVKALRGTSFAPSGITDDPDIRTASSITDYIMRRLALDYLSFDDQLELGLVSIDDMPDNQLSLIEGANEDGENDGIEIVEQIEVVVKEEKQTNSKASMPVKDSTAPLCYNCGNQTQRSGNCYVCSSCGSTTGCS